MGRQNSNILIMYEDYFYMYTYVLIINFNVSATYQVHGRNK